MDSTRLCEGRGPGSTPGRDTDLTTLKSHGVAAACKAADRGFDSHRRLFAGEKQRISGRGSNDNNPVLAEANSLTLAS
jgi:hypothetical protein